MTKNFTKSQFKCKCGCGLDDINPKLVAKLQLARDIYGQPIKITSGCRCLKHNQSVGSKPTSSHVKCLAADITVNNPNEFNLIKLAFCLGRAGFTRIGINVKSKFIHVDVDTSKPDSIFSY